MLFIFGITRVGQRGAKCRIRPAGRSLPGSVQVDTGQSTEDLTPSPSYVRIHLFCTPIERMLLSTLPHHLYFWHTLYSTAETGKNHNKIGSNWHYDKGKAIPGNHCQLLSTVCTTCHRKDDFRSCYRSFSNVKSGAVQEKINGGVRS